MKRGDEVFFFTLVDLFAQVMFFGLLLFAIQRAKERADLPIGISNITELADSLGRMTSEVQRAKALQDSIRNLGGLPFLRRISDSATALTAKVQAQYGLPPCGGHERYIATAVLTDDFIELIEMSPTMDTLLSDVLKTSAAAVRRLQPAEFIAAFKPLATAFPDCRYFVRMRRLNRLEAPALAVYSAFRTELRRLPR